MASQDPAQARLARDNNVVHTSRRIGPIKPFGESVLPRRSASNRLVPYAHGAQSTCDDGAKDAISIADAFSASSRLFALNGEAWMPSTKRSPLSCRQIADSLTPPNTDEHHSDNDSDLDSGDGWEESI